MHSTVIYLYECVLRMLVADEHELDKDNVNCSIHMMAIYEQINLQRSRVSRRSLLEPCMRRSSRAAADY